MPAINDISDIEALQNDVMMCLIDTPTYGIDIGKVQIKQRGYNSKDEFYLTEIDIIDRTVNMTRIIINNYHQQIRYVDNPKLSPNELKFYSTLAKRLAKLLKYNQVNYL